MRAAVAQLGSGRDKAANRRRAGAVVAAAAAAGAGLVVLPEASMHGFDAAGADLSPIAEPLDGPFVTALAAESAASGIVVVAGLFEPAPVPGRVFNTVVIVGSGGVLARYRKVHLYDALGWRESDQVQPGDPTEAPAVVDVDGLHLGVMTCFDLRFPESARVLAEAGATVLGVPAAWVAGPGKREQWEVLLRARAIENGAFVLGAAQPEPAFTGHSAIVGPSGDLLGALPGSDATGRGTLAFADLDAAEVETVRASMPLLGSRRFAVRPA
jgi:predicted amidohydrolase